MIALSNVICFFFYSSLVIEKVVRSRFGLSATSSYSMALIDLPLVCKPSTSTLAMPEWSSEVLYSVSELRTDKADTSIFHM